MCIYYKTTNTVYDADAKLSSQFLKFSMLWAAFLPEGVQERTNTTVPYEPLYTYVKYSLVCVWH